MKNLGNALMLLVALLLLSCAEESPPAPNPLLERIPSATMPFEARIVERTAQSVPPQYQRHSMTGWVESEHLVWVLFGPMDENGLALASAGIDNPWARIDLVQDAEKFGAYAMNSDGQGGVWVALRELEGTRPAIHIYHVTRDGVQTQIDVPREDERPQNLDIFRPPGTFQDLAIAHVPGQGEGLAPVDIVWRNDWSVDETDLGTEVRRARYFPEDGRWETDVVLRHDGQTTGNAVLSDGRFEVGHHTQILHNPDGHLAVFTTRTYSNAENDYVEWGGSWAYSPAVGESEVLYFGFPIEWPRAPLVEPFSWLLLDSNARGEVWFVPTKLARQADPDDPRWDAYVGLKPSRIKHLHQNWISLDGPVSDLGCGQVPLRAFQGEDLLEQTQDAYSICPARRPLPLQRTDVDPLAPVFSHHSGRTIDFYNRVYDTQDTSAQDVPVMVESTPVAGALEVSQDLNTIEIELAPSSFVSGQGSNPRTNFSPITMCVHSLDGPDGYCEKPEWDGTRASLKLRGWELRWGERYRVSMQLQKPDGQALSDSELWRWLDHTYPSFEFRVKGGRDRQRALTCRATLVGPGAERADFWVETPDWPELELKRTDTRSDGKFMIEIDGLVSSDELVLRLDHTAGLIKEVKDLRQEPQDCDLGEYFVLDQIHFPTAKDDFYGDYQISDKLHLGKIQPLSRGLNLVLPDGDSSQVFTFRNFNDVNVNRIEARNLEFLNLSPHVLLFSNDEGREDAIFEIQRSGVVEHFPAFRAQPLLTNSHRLLGESELGTLALSNFGSLQVEEFPGERPIANPTADGFLTMNEDSQVILRSASGYFQELQFPGAPFDPEKETLLRRGLPIIGPRDDNPCDEPCRIVLFWDAEEEGVEIPVRGVASTRTDILILTDEGFRTISELVRRALAPAEVSEEALARIDEPWKNGGDHFYQIKPEELVIMRVNGFIKTIPGSFERTENGHKDCTGSPCRFVEIRQDPPNAGHIWQHYGSRFGGRSANFLKHYDPTVGLVVIAEEETGQEAERVVAPGLEVIFPSESGYNVFQSCLIATYDINSTHKGITCLGSRDYSIEN